MKKVLIYLFIVILIFGISGCKEIKVSEKEIVVENTDKSDKEIVKEEEPKIVKEEIAKEEVSEDTTLLQKEVESLELYGITTDFENGFPGDYLDTFDEGIKKIYAVGGAINLKKGFTMTTLWTLPNGEEIKDISVFESDYVSNYFELHLENPDGLEMGNYSVLITAKVNGEEISQEAKFTVGKPSTDGEKSE